MLSSGLFYGLHIPNISGLGLEANNDFGTSISIGLQRKRFFAKLDFKKGLTTNIRNSANSSFKTNILGFKIGYSFYRNQIMDTKSS